MVGLVNAMTMGVLERTREIGIPAASARAVATSAASSLRGAGAHSPGLGAAVSLGYGLERLLLGYGLERLLVWLIRSELDVVVDVAYPGWNVPLALAGTVALGLVSMLLPLRRAVRLQPGDALRYG